MSWRGVTRHVMARFDRLFLGLDHLILRRLNSLDFLGLALKGEVQDLDGFVLGRQSLFKGPDDRVRLLDDCSVADRHRIGWGNLGFPRHTSP